MLRIPLPFTDAYLMLTPRWGEMSLAAQVGFLALLALVPVALVLFLYRYELKLVKGVTAAGLLLLRLVTLAALVLLVGFQPIFARTKVEELPGQVLIAVDRSDSMSVNDPQRPVAEKLRLAKGLHLAADVCPDERLEEWAKQADEGGSITRWVTDEEAGKAEGRTALEQERRKQLAEVVRRVDALTRTATAGRVLSDEGGRLLSGIGSRHKVEMAGFSQEIWDVKPDAVDSLVKPGAAREGKPEDKPEEKGSRAGMAFTDLRLPLTRALERSGPEQSKVLGVVVLTDGQHNWGSSPVRKAIELGEHQLPVFPVVLGSRNAPPDVAVVAVKAPTAVFKDVDTQVEARVKVSGIRDRKQLVVQLQRPGQEPLEETIAHDGTDRYYSVRFQTRLPEPGTQTLNVAARPLAEDTRPDNNTRPVTINVADDKARVLMIDGEARWEYHYLASALERDRTMRPQGVVFQQPRVGKVPEEELKKSGNPWLTLPTEPDALSVYDCIVLGDVAAAQLTAADRQRLEKYVADRGGTLVIVAGKRAMPLAYVGAEGSEADPLARLLPIEQPKVVKPVQGFPVTLTYDGRTTPFLQMEPEPDRNEKRWAELPKHYWGVVGRAKPGATVLAWVNDGEAAPDKPDPKADPAAREREQALIARQNYGFGRVLYVGLDSTWRWRFKVGDTYHHRFWGQAIRWAASEKPLVTGNEFVRFGTRDAVHRQGQEVDLVVRLAEEAGNLPAGAVAGARVLRVEGAKEEAVALVPLARKEAQPRLLEGKLRDLPSGQYVVELVIPDLADKLNAAAGADGQVQRLRATFTVAPPDSEEMVELAANQPLLEELAVKSGGQLFTADNTQGLIDALQKRATRHEERTENRLWQWWVTLAGVVSLLTIEWVARKWAGLP